MEELELTGRIMPTQRDKGMNLIEIGIVTDTFEVFPVVGDELSRGLFDELYRRVRVRGAIVGSGHRHQKLVEIREYEFI